MSPTSIRNLPVRLAYCLVLAGVYFVLCRFSVLLSFPPSEISTVLPAAGVALGAMMLWGYQLWPGIFLGSLVFTASLHFPLWASVGTAVGNTGETLVAAWVMHRYCGGRDCFRRLANVCRFILFGAGLGTLFSAVLGVGSLCVMTPALWPHLATLLFAWWLGPLVAMMTITPLMLIWWPPDFSSVSRSQVLRLLGYLALPLGGSLLVFSPWTPWARAYLPLAYLPILAVVWTTLRTGNTGGLVSLLLVEMVGTYATLQGSGPFAEAGGQESLLLLQSHLASLCLLTLGAGAFVSEKGETQKQLYALTHQLEQHFTRRTEELTRANAALSMEVERRQVAEEALVREEDLYRTLVDNLPGGVVSLFNHELRYTIVAGSGMAGSGMVHEALVGKTVWEALPAKLSEFLAPLFSGALAGKTCRTEMTYAGRTYQLHVVPVKDQQGAIFSGMLMAYDISERKQVEENLLESDTRHRLLFEKSPLPMWLYDLETQEFLAVNESAVLQYGYSQKEFLSLRVQHLCSAASTTPWLDPLAAAAHGTGETVRVKHRRKDGRLMEMETTAHDLSFDGRRARMVIARDITARQEVEMAREEERNLLRTLIDNLPDHIYTKDLLGRFVINNRSNLRMLKVRTEEEAAGRTVFDFFPPDLASVYHARDLEVISGGHPTHNQEEPFLGEGGNTCYYSTTKIPLRDPSGKVIGLVGISRDITPYKRAEAQVREQATLIDKARDAIVVCNLDGSVVYWNKSAQTLYGWTMEEAMGRHVDTLLLGEQKLFEEAKVVLLEKGDWTGEMPLVNRKGRDQVVEGRWTLVRDNLGKPKSVLCINTDITEKKRLETQFLRAQRMESIGRLASGVAHDLNNILAPILMSVPMLREGLRTEEREKVFFTIETSAQRGAEITKQLLTFARGVSGARVTVQMSHLIRDMAKMARQTFTKKINVTSRLAPNLWTLQGDATQLHQVLMNLCVNAQDAMPDGGTLTLRAENVDLDEDFIGMNEGVKPGPYVLVQVSDTGTGIPRELLDKVFDPFFTTKEQGKGSGLGLSTVLGIVKSHGGFVNIFSESNQGTSFKVYLPATPQAAFTRPEKQPEARKRGRGELVLVVDDEVNIHHAMRRTLERNGYKVVTASDGVEAVLRFTEYRGEIKAVLTDIMMPSMDGMHLIRVLRKMDPALAIMASSGLGDAAKREELDLLGVTTFLPKPYTIDTLLLALDELLQAGSSPPPINLLWGSVPVS